MKVKKVTLLLIACIVWMAAGFNILFVCLLTSFPKIKYWNTVNTIIDKHKLKIDK